MAYPVPYNVPPAPDGRTVQELSVPIYQARGWLKFLGVLFIIAGVGQALSIVGILFAWLPIWMGMLMFQAGSNIGQAAQFGDRFAFLRSLGSLKTFFVLMGVLALIGIILSAVMLCIAIVLPLLGITLIPWGQIFNEVYNSINVFNSIY